MADQEQRGGEHSVTWAVCLLVAVRPASASAADHVAGHVVGHVAVHEAVVHVAGPELGRALSQWEHHMQNRDVRAGRHRVSFVEVARYGAPCRVQVVCQGRGGRNRIFAAERLP